MRVIAKGAIMWVVAGVAVALSGAVGLMPPASARAAVPATETVRPSAPAQSSQTPAMTSPQGLDSPRTTAAMTPLLLASPNLTVP